MKPLRIAVIIAGLAVAATACDLYWGTSTQKTGPNAPDASTYYPDGGVQYPDDGGSWHDDGGPYPDGWPHYPDAACCSGCEDAGGYLPDAYTGP
jgi:hypothetical protein